MSRRTAKRARFYADRRTRRSRRRVWQGMRAHIERGITLNFDKLHEQLFYGSCSQRTGKRIDPRSVYLPYTQGPARRIAQDEINRRSSALMHAVPFAPMVQPDRVWFDEAATFTPEQWEKAGKPMMRDGTPADPEDFGVVTIDLASKG